MRATTRWQRAFDDAGAALDDVAAVGHRIVHGGARFVEPVVDRRRRRRRDRGAHRVGTAPQRPRPRRHPRRAREAARPPAGRLLRHRVPRHDARRRPRVRRAAPMARRRPAAVRLPRVEPRARDDAQRGAPRSRARRRAVGVVSPRRWVVDRRRRPRAQRRHHHGLHAARRARDGDPRRVRSTPGCCSTCSGTARRSTSSTTCSSGAPACSDSRA